MLIFNKVNQASIVMGALAGLLLVGCGGSSYSSSDDMDPPPPPPPVTYAYQVTVTNLTHAQPMSPVAVVLHNEGQLWQIGESASNALEVMAESGDNSGLLSDAIAMASESGVGILAPGMSETISVSIVDTEPMMLSVATMLVNTNDAFTGVNAMALTNLPAGESISLTAGSYDAGTEKNSELMSSIPGPAGGGEGYNEMRDDVDFVAMHPGVVTSDDGLSTSVLTQAHRFDNPSLRISITRTE
mgnify:CR=1 FL=1